MPILDPDNIQRLERIVVDGTSYNLHVRIHRSAVHSTVIGQSAGGTYLPSHQWAEGVRAADALLGDTSNIGRWHAYPHCALLIRQQNESVQIRTREHYLIDLDGDVN